MNCKVTVLLLRTLKWLWQAVKQITNGETEQTGENKELYFVEEKRIVVYGGVRNIGFLPDINEDQYSLHKVACGGAVG
jgi:hypothetical protein